MKIKVFFLSILSMALFISSAQAAQKTIKLATSDWPPYVSQDLKNNGYVYHIVKQVFAKAGYDMQSQFLPWQEVLDFKKYHTEGIFPEYNNQVNNMLCSAPILGGPIALYKRASTNIHFTVTNPQDNQEQAFAELKQYRFGIVEGYINTEAFDSAGYLQKRAVSTDQENLAQLAKGKVDLIITDVFVAEYIKDKNKPKFDNLILMPPSLENKQLYVCISKDTQDYKEKIKAFNKTLLQMQKNGEIDKLLHDSSS